MWLCSVQLVVFPVIQSSLLCACPVLLWVIVGGGVLIVPFLCFLLLVLLLLFSPFPARYISLDVVVLSCSICWYLVFFAYFSLLWGFYLYPLSYSSLFCAVLIPVPVLLPPSLFSSSLAGLVPSSCWFPLFS